jgi:C-terminal processing protease CtpA/Prc
VLRIGDEVLSVDSLVVVGQPPDKVEEALKGKVGSEVTIGFQRNGVHKKAAITRTVTGVQWADK